MESDQAVTLKNNKRNPLYGLLFVGIVFICFFLSIFFKIDEVVCRANQNSCSQTTVDELNKLKGNSLFFTDFNQKLAAYNLVRLEKRLPGTLIIEIEETKKSFFQLVDFEIKETNFENHDPDITGIANDLISHLQQNQLAYQKIELINQVLVVYFNVDDQSYRALIDRHEIELGVYRLKIVLTHVDLKSQVDIDVKEIDTRFKLPVLKTQFTNI